MNHQATASGPEGRPLSPAVRPVGTTLTIRPRRICGYHEPTGELPGRPFFVSADPALAQSTICNKVEPNEN